MNIQMNEEQMTALVSKAIFDSLTTEAKDELLQKALRHLMTKAKPAYGSAPARSLLEEAFQSSAYLVTRQIATERLENSAEFKANLESLFADLGRKLFEGDIREKLISKMADSIISNLRAD